MYNRHHEDIDYVEAYYSALANENVEALKRLDIPRSDVFYVREAIFQRNGVVYSIEHVRKAMKAEGYDV